MFEEKFRVHRNKFIIICAALLTLNFFVFSEIRGAGSEENENLKIYFLDVDQGDSELVIFPGGVKLLIDGGMPNGKVLTNLERILGSRDRYIDLVLMTHPQLDHFGGLIDVMNRYRIGAFLWSGKEATIGAFADLQKSKEKNGIRDIILEKGDMLTHGVSRIDVLSPTSDLLESRELNDSTVVVELSSANAKALFTGDIGFKSLNVEEKIARSVSGPIDILKVPHHGSKYSSSDRFLATIKSKLAFIEVGKNSYGHPTEETLNRLQKYGTKIYRADRDGTIGVFIDGEKMKILEY